MKISEFPRDKKVYLFELDNVLYPKQDFLLQVYYLFAQFLEFTEARPISAEMVSFMKETLVEKGEDAVFDETLTQFNLKAEYRENFERLQVNGHLPLKLFLFDEIKTLFKELSTVDVQIAVLTKGNPALQLNKLRHIDWEGYDRKLKVYFVDELAFRNIEPFTYIASENNVNVEDLHFTKTKLTK
ncbi:HAD hydrolase-like protein [Sphingobacterium sp. DK4209]|uniref:HAD hydrolase-like protein n=1 Tax=Sphingobacterium zhuxiongii TaxID=2662364 RepID=A0A5Q0QHM2_9SPHI|nr:MULTISPECIES: HAD hydrolase-like protein [unclassified Sphingobacterium]MVZ67294.1 HAD hydrolase-like protein [Sphingobacterium sp. DK4209]QGA27638.1 HAD hydrolase-like protein [Sphingobacterium sp. dk4302]